MRIPRTLLVSLAGAVAVGAWTRRDRLKQLAGSMGRRREVGGATTLLEVLDAAESTGYSTEFVIEAGTIVCGACSHPSAPGDMPRSWMHRLEGASDPDELLTVSALQCPACGAKGTIVLPFGPSANADEGDVSRSLREPADHDMAPVGAESS